MIPIFLTAKISRVPCGLSKAGLAFLEKIILAALRYFSKKPCSNPVHGCNGRKKTGTLAPRAGLCLIKKFCIYENQHQSRK